MLNLMCRTPLRTMFSHISGVSREPLEIMVILFP